jgi:hypothetical protein
MKNTLYYGDNLQVLRMAWPAVSLPCAMIVNPSVTAFAGAD